MSLPLQECLERVSYREYLLWMRYFKEDLDTPSRSDYYLMQIAQEVKRVLSKKPRKINLKDFLINFNKPQKKPLTLEEKTAESKSFWGLMKSVNTLGRKKPDQSK